jgi:hypothetical protein
MADKIYISNEIKDKIYQVANQYQCQLILRSWLWFGINTILLVLFTTIALKLASAIGFSKLWLLAFFVAAEIVNIVYFLFWKFNKPVDAEQIALYMEEKYPEIENRLITAIELENGKIQGASPWMVRRFLEESNLSIQQLSFSELVNSDTLVKLSLITVAAFVFSFLIVAGFYSLWIPSMPTLSSDSFVYSEIPDYSIEPGDIRIRQGSTQTVVCKIKDSTDKLSIRWRYRNQPWVTETMTRSTSDAIFHHAFLSVQNTIEYQIVSDQFQSRHYTISTWLPPRVETIDLTYHYPPYLRMDDKIVQNAGAISGIEGGTVEIVVWVNKELQTASMQIKSGSDTPLQKQSEYAWHTVYPLTKNDDYSILLTDPEGETNQPSQEYKITVQSDLPPEIKLVFPKQDLEVNALEEIPIAFSVHDDYGINAYGIQYEIAGHEPVQVTLSQPAMISKESENEYTLYLEDLHLEAGDFITWTVWANDEKPDRHDFETMGDPYFLEIRPFKKEYEEAMTTASTMQMQGQPNEDNQAGTQKEIVIAIWNLRKESAGMEESEFDDRKTIIAKEQQNLHDATLENGPGDNVQLQRELLGLMESVTQTLQEARHSDPYPSLTQAYLDAQKAYRLILRMKPERTTIQQQLAQNQSSQGGGQSQENSPEMDALDLDRTRNFYEEESRTQQQQQLEQSDTALSRIKELAERQKHLNEEISKLISEQQTEEDEEEIKRRLERLQEEEQRNLERLDETAQSLAQGDMRDENTRESLNQLNEAREQMNRSLENLQNNQLQQARLSGQRASRSLDQMEEHLQELSRDAAGQRLAQLQESFTTMREKQDAVVQQLESIQEEQNAPTLLMDENVDEKKQDLLQRKNEVSQEFMTILEEMATLAERSDTSQPLMSRKLNDWLRRTSQRGILEQMQREEREPLIQYGIWEPAIAREQDIVNQLSDVEDELSGLSQTIIANDLEAMQRVLESLENLAGQPTSTPQGSSASVDSASAGNPGSTTDSNGQTTQATTDIAMSNGNESSQSENPQQQTQQASSQNPGSEPGQANSQQPNGQPQGLQSEQPQNSQRNPQPSNDRIRNTANSGGGFGERMRSPLETLRTPESFLRFLSDEGRGWLETIRDSELMLPDASQSREELTQVRESMETMRGEYTGDDLRPAFDLYIEKIVNPLITTVQNLEENIRKQRSKEEFAIVDEQEVPAQYQDHVAEYFKAISETEPIQTP